MTSKKHKHFHSFILLISLFLATNVFAGSDDLDSTNAKSPEILQEYSKILPNLTFETALKSLQKEPPSAQVPEKLDDINWLPPIQQALVSHLISQYGLSSSLANNVITSVFHSGRFYNIDPLLLLAVMKVESTFNPKAVSPANAKGLMQVLPKAHPEKIALIGGVDRLYTPHLNVKMGAQILRDCVDRAGGVIARGLQFYNGAGKDPTQKYANKVLLAHQEFISIKSSIANPVIN